MNRRLILYLTLCFSISISNAQEIRKILFLGNSYTAVNNLPQTIHDIAKTMGDSVYFNSNTPGSCTLQIHSTDATSISLIQSEKWDYVVLQEQSQLPSFPPSQVATEVFPYATKLDSIIKANDSCTETVFYMTWGRKNGDATNCVSYPQVCTYEGMQERLRQSYLQMGIDNSATVAPVGMAWYKTRLLNPSFDLYAADESHPSFYGTYLTACVFYSTLFHRSAEGCSYISSLALADATLLQQVAASTVFDSLDQWAEPGDKAYARFTYSQNVLNFQFNDTSLNATNWSWGFGDGTTSTTHDPFHTYVGPGYYVVMLIASNNCFSDTIYETLNLNPFDITTCEKNPAMVIYPNPSTGIFNIESLPDNISYCGIYSLSGKLITSLDKYDLDRKKIDLTDFPCGMYILNARTPETTFHVLLLKE
jgi:hypothetical protein